MFQEKMDRLLNAMKAENFEPFDSPAEACEFIEERLEKIINYVQTVAGQVATAQMLRFKYDGQDLIAVVEERNARRINAHNLCIASFRQLNNLCSNCNIELFTDVDFDNRVLVAEEAGKFFNECFDLGLHENYFENAVELASQKAYDTSVPKGRWLRIGDVEI
jgi:hypothetical protein